MADGGGTISEVYQASRRRLLRARGDVERVERAGGDVTSSEFVSSLRRELAEIGSMCGQMDRLWRSVAAKPQRDLWKRKVEQVAEEVDSLKDSLEKYVLRHQKRMLEAKERAELLERANGDSAHVMRVFDEEAQAMQSVRNSSNMIEEAYATGVAILSKYAEQRDRLKRAQRKALDILNTVGLSNTVLKLIEKRHRTDKRIAYGGMVATVIIVFMFYWWLRH
ncbi:membrin-11-like [Nymphaea colorata]|nr:membrin-11-like [Nymphaea colorata]